MNDARSLYLSTYGLVNKIYHYLRNTNMYYQSWKYRHAAMNHAKAMAVVVAYDIYIECCEGKLNPAWYVKDPLPF